MGLHVDLSEWAYRDGHWELLYERVPLEDAAAVSGELDAEVALFHDLLSCDPTHLASRQHVYPRRSATRAFRSAAERPDVPVRHFTPRVIYCGEFYGRTRSGEPYRQAISIDRLCVTRALPGDITRARLPSRRGRRQGGTGTRPRMTFEPCAMLVSPTSSRGEIELHSFAEVATDRQFWRR